MTRKNILKKIKQICENFGIRSQYRFGLFSFVIGEAFLDAFTENSFAIVFMDIYMKDMDDYLSTKHDGKGIGRSLINAAAQKYHGSMRISHSGQKFFADVMIKVQTPALTTRKWGAQRLLPSPSSAYPPETHRKPSFHPWRHLPLSISCVSAEGLQKPPSFKAAPMQA